MPDKQTSDPVFKETWKYGFFVLLAIVCSFLIGSFTLRKEYFTINAAIAGLSSRVDSLELSRAAFSDFSKVPRFTAQDGRDATRCQAINTEIIMSVLEGTASQSDARTISACKKEMDELSNRLKDLIRDAND